LRRLKILWIKTDFLHPTTRGGQIRTLELLKQLHKRHEIHYVCFDFGRDSEGPARSGEYCTQAYSIPHRVPQRRSFQFAVQLVTGLFSPLPVAVSRFQSRAMRKKIESLTVAQPFDCIVCDFLFPSPNIPDLSQAVLFQHNVEATIWKRYAKKARNSISRAYFAMQARRMESCERSFCRAARHVIAVSENDFRTMREDYGVSHLSVVPTGVDFHYFSPEAQHEKQSDLVFVGSMDWFPNNDGARFFVEQILPLIRRRRPTCRVAFVGRNPDPAVRQLARRDPDVIVTGTVPDVRPWLWGAAISIVPLRIGGGTRLKIFEAMAARVPVVSTSIGAEGLPVSNGDHLLIADEPSLFAESCLELLEDEDRRQRLASAAQALVAARFSWEFAARELEDILAANTLRQ
jgi:glycosyltransferase involved in cell wall biosynthesis